MRIEEARYQRRRNHLREIVGGGVILLHRGDEAFNENLYYLTGLDTYHTTVIISLDNDFEAAFTWPPDYEQARSVGLEVYVTQEPLGERVIQCIAKLKPKRIYTDYSINAKTPLPGEFCDLLQRQFPWIEITDLPTQLIEMRLIKDEGELSCLREISRIANKAMKEAKKIIAPGLSELDVAAKIAYTLFKEGAQGIREPILASGPNTAIPHHAPSKRIIQENEPVLVDIYGAHVGHYVCDHTHTFCSSGEFTGRKKEILEAVDEAYQAVLREIRKGQTLNGLTKVASNIFTKLGLERYFFNRIGHFIGLSDHDPGGFDVPLREGMVFTIEPHLYLPEEELGVRVEDAVLLTTKGVEVLGNNV